MRRNLSFSIPVFNKRVAGAAQKRRRSSIRRNGSRGTTVELKSRIISGDAAADATGELVLLNGLVQGDDISERIGRHVFSRKLECRFIHKATLTTGTDQAHRIIVFIDHQSNGTTPAITDVLTSVSYLSALNPSNALRFQILHDRLYYLNASGEAGSGITEAVTIPVNCHVHFNSGTAGTVADITTNSVYLLSIGAIPAGASAGTTAYNIAHRFTDE